MQTSKYSARLFKHHPQKISVNRGTLIVVLCGLLCLMGVATFYADAASPISSPAIHSRTSNGNNVLPMTSANQQAARRYLHPALHQTLQTAQRPFDFPVYYGNPRLPEIALTFDDGPNPIYTPQVLAILQKYQVKATFFDIGYLVKDFPNIVRQEFLQGHSIGNHSWSHPQLTRLSPSSILSQLVSTSDAIQAVTGMRPTIFRPPYGAFNRVVFAQAFQQNLTSILWDNEGRDWATPGANVIVYRILRLAHNGSIILLHDGGGFRYQTVEALPIIITALKQRGFTFVTVPQLLQDMATSGKPAPAPSSSVTDASSFSTIFPAGFIAWKQE